MAVLKTTIRILGESQHREAMLAYARAFFVPKTLRNGKWRQTQAAIMAKDPEVAYLYAKNVLKDRFLEGEAAIASSEYYKKVYLQTFPEVADDWATYGWLDWLDT
jgi:hypothetical protein